MSGSVHCGPTPPCVIYSLYSETHVHVWDLLGTNTYLKATISNASVLSMNMKSFSFIRSQGCALNHQESGISQYIR